LVQKKIFLEQKFKVLDNPHPKDFYDIKLRFQ